MTARLPTTVFDELGRTLTIAGTADAIHVQVETANRQKLAMQTCELDADQAVLLAHDLLERALPRADCDEITAAVTALRALADRTDALYVQGESMTGDDR